MYREWKGRGSIRKEKAGRTEKKKIMARTYSRPLKTRLQSHEGYEESRLLSRKRAGTHNGSFENPRCHLKCSDMDYAVSTWVDRDYPKAIERNTVSNAVGVPGGHSPDQIKESQKILNPLNISHRFSDRRLRMKLVWSRVYGGGRSRGVRGAEQVIRRVLNGKRHVDIGTGASKLRPASAHRTHSTRVRPAWAPRCRSGRRTAPRVIAFASRALTPSESYNYTVQYVRSANNVADYLSRSHPQARAAADGSSAGHARRRGRCMRRC
ncbi:hypothetical protein EVAR_16134_1 [Eumeta japonica]|uniref:Uncharacterized protein n=1 Tax=Eumeta variegata TaxID=151549 RepID=A0A4C1WAQ7_EUMVA|nr:hypothetical protein EVAR_16134_1 [Eumeta japonica]